MGSSSYKKRMGPIEKQGVVQAYTMLVPTVAIVMAIVLFPLIAIDFTSFGIFSSKSYVDSISLDLI